MAVLELAIAFVVITILLVGGVIWFSKEAAKADEREKARSEELLRQKQMVRRLARRQRRRADIVKWMRAQGDD